MFIHKLHYMRSVLVCKQHAKEQMISVLVCKQHAKEQSQ